MASTSVPGTSPGDNPQDDDPILARLLRLDELRLRVRADMSIGAVVIDVAGMPDTDDADLTLAPRHALSLALALVGAVGRLERLGREP